MAVRRVWKLEDKVIDCDGVSVLSGGIVELQDENLVVRIFSSIGDVSIENRMNVGNPLDEYFDNQLLKDVETHRQRFATELALQEAKKKK